MENTNDVETKKINVLVVPSDQFGVGHWRSIWPHTKLDELYGNEFEVTIDNNPNWNDIHSFDKYDIVHFHKGLFQNMDSFRNALKYFKEKNIVTIMDIDDNWDVGQFHPLYLTSKRMGISEKITENLRLVDYVTTTTSIFADKIKKYNKNVYVFPNAVDPKDEQFYPIKTPSDRIRFGFVMGSSHKRDMEQFMGVVSTFDKELLNKIQIVLCGYDLRGTTSIIDKNGNITGKRNIMPMESVWYEYEMNVTNKFNIISEEYKNFLLKFIPNTQWPNVQNEPYRREWTKDLNNFGKHYQNIDVLLAPLDCNQFNEVKSELKFVEAGFTKTAIVCSDFGPYHLVGNSMFKKYGEVDESGNCVLIDPSKKHKDWSKTIKKLVQNPELIDLLKNNLHKFAIENYNLDDVTAKRAEWYHKIVKKKKE